MTSIQSLVQSSSGHPSSTTGLCSQVPSHRLCINNELDIPPACTIALPVTVLSSLHHAAPVYGNRTNLPIYTQPQPVRAPHATDYAQLQSRPAQTHLQPVFTANALRPSLYPQSAGLNFDSAGVRVSVVYASLSSPYVGPSSAQTSPVTMPYVPSVDPYMKAVSDHAMQQEISAQGTEPFTGDAASFWSWLGRMQENITSFSMKPRAILNMLSTNTKGAPHAMILTRMSTTGVVDSTTVASVWSELIRRYGSQQLAFNQQLAKIKSFPPLKAPNISDQLYEFADLCYVTCTLFPHLLVLFPA